MTRPGATSGPEAVLADLLSDLANRSLDLDPTGRARLETLEGREIQISAELPGPLGRRDFTLAVSAGRLRCFARPAEAPNVIVRGTAADLAAWVLGAAGRAAGGLSIDGDSTVLAELAGLLHAFRPDLAGPLGRVLGAEGARTLLGTAELAFAGLRSALEGAGRSVRAGASQAFVDRPSAARFLDELDDLRLRVDRLGARVAAQEQRRAEPPRAEP